MREKNIDNPIVEGISLGWDCSAAQDGLRLSLRKTKQDGYKTCPFDMMISNYIGLCKCIDDDFKYFCDINYLELRNAPDMTKHIPNQKTDEQWIYNTYYNFAFNHESPFHGDLYKNEMWDGPYHFVNNNFEKFIERYNNRINNFRKYISESDKINFILWRYNSPPIELVEILKNKYPNLDFTVNTIINFGPHTMNCLIHNNPIDAKLYQQHYLKYMGLDEEHYPEEFNRYKTDYQSLNQIYENINLIDPINNTKLQ
jgi:hypothetical protein